MRRFSISRVLNAAAPIALYAVAVFVIVAACESTRGPTEQARIDLISTE